MDIPVYLFTGFLDAGKTRFIQETLEDERFNTGERILLLVCEEGEEEYEPSTFASPNVFIEQIEEPEDLTAETLSDLRKKHRCKSVMVEYNGMWLLDDLYAALPENWLVAQEFFFADANTILTYNDNMRNLVGDKLKSCELAVFNRFPAGRDKLPYHQLVRNFSRRTDIAYEYPDGNVAYDDIEDPLPFDLEAPIIEIEDDAYALWYRDMTEEMDKYEGKTVRVRVRAVQKRSLGSEELVVGRDLMTCCAADIQFAGLVCRMGPLPLPENKSWLLLTARLSLEVHKAYKRKGPVLRAVSWKACAAPEQEVATYY